MNLGKSMKVGYIFGPQKNYYSIVAEKSKLNITGYNIEFKNYSDDT